MSPGMAMCSTSASMSRGNALANKAKQNRFRETYIYFSAEGENPAEAIRTIEKQHPGARLLTSETSGETLITVEASEENELVLTSKALLEDLGNRIIAGPDETLPAAFFAALTARNFTVALAESITGGMIASRILDQPGASRILKEAYIVYGEDAKQKILRIDQEIIREHGAVSAECAWEMAKNLEIISHADLIVTSAGYAGPTGGTPADPIGTVYFGFGIFGNRETVRKRFSGSRNVVRRKASAYALAYVISKLRNEGEERT